MVLYQKVRPPVLPDGKIQILWSELERGKRTVIDYDIHGRLRNHHVHTNPHNGVETEMGWWRRVNAGVAIVTEHGDGSRPPKPALTQLEYMALIKHDLLINNAGVLDTSNSVYAEI